MIDEKYIELMNTEIDGVNSVEQSSELAAFLKSNPEAREYFDGLRATTKTIDSVPSVEAPPGLYHRVMSHIPHPATPVPHPSPGGGIGEWLRGLFARPQLRFAATFAAGLVIGVTIYSLITGDSSFRQPLDLSEFAGTMATIDSKKGFDQIADLDVSLAGVEGYVHLHQSGETMIADVALDANRQIEWALGYDGTEVTLAGLRQLGRAGSLSSTSDETRVTQDGEGRYVLLFREHNRVPSPMTLRIYDRGNLVFESPVPGI